MRATVKLVRVAFHKRHGLMLSSLSALSLGTASSCWGGSHCMAGYHQNFSFTVSGDGETVWSSAGDSLEGSPYVVHA